MTKVCHKQNKQLRELAVWHEASVECILYTLLESVDASTISGMLQYMQDSPDEDYSEVVKRNLKNE